MSINDPVDRDERTVALENAGFRWGFLLLTYALLLDVALRSFLRHEQSWDLLGLVIVLGVIMAAYQGRRGLLTRGWALAAFGALAVGVLLSVLTVLLR